MFIVKLKLQVTKELSIEKKLENMLFPMTIKLGNAFELIIYFNRVSRSHLAVRSPKSSRLFSNVCILSF